MKKSVLGCINVSKRFVISMVFLMLLNMSAVAWAEPEKTEVVYGGSSWLGHYPAWVGIQKGTFKNRGLDVIFQQFYTSSARMVSLVSGDVDFASTGSISALALMATGLKSFYVFATQDSYATVEGIIARQEIKSVKDLKGKKLAVTFASSAHVLVLDILEQNGLKPREDVILINLKVSEMPAAFKSGEVDACALWTPMFNKLLRTKGARVLINDTEFSLFKKYGLGPGPDLLVVRKDFVKKYPRSTKAFLNGYFEALQLLKDSPGESAEVLTKLTQLTMKEQMAVLRDIEWYGLEKQRELMDVPGSFVKGLQQLADFLVKHKQIDKAPTVRNWVNTKILR